MEKENYSPLSWDEQVDLTRITPEKCSDSKLHGVNNSNHFYLKYIVTNL